MAVVRRTLVGDTRTDYRSEGVRPAVARRVHEQEMLTLEQVFHAFPLKI
jgi:hypothetical protein